MSDSSYDFQRTVWPYVCPKIGGGELVMVEGHASDAMRAMLDMQAGIDGWHVHSTEGLRGIGSRVQWLKTGVRPFNTFTVRRSRASGAETEYEKRCRAIYGHGGYLYPHLTIQAYIREPRRQGDLVSLGIARTCDVVEYIGAHLGTIEVRHVMNGGAASFFVVPWAHFRSCGYPLKGGVKAMNRQRGLF